MYIEAGLKSASIFLGGIMGTISQEHLIMSTSRAIEDNTTLFYQQKNKEGYEMLESTLALLIQTTNGILDSQIESDELHIDVQNINDILSKAMNAMESGDTILLSDILYFDLKPLLEKHL